MNLEIHTAEGSIPHHVHEGQDYFEVPKKGTYWLRLTNNSPNRRAAVVTIDGVNIVDGKEGDVNGSPYVLAPWQSIDIKGWLRSNSEVAAFEFQPATKSYVAQAGHGTKNTGVIGLAVFDEKPKPISTTIYVPVPTPVYPTPPWPTTWPRSPFWYGTTDHTGEVRCGGALFPENSATGSTLDTLSATAPATASAPATMSATRSNARHRRGSVDKETKTSGALFNLGTGYGERLTQHTHQTTFDRAPSPALVRVYRYAVRAQLVEWGVVSKKSPKGPNAFPAAAGFVPAPPGYRG